MDACCTKEQRTALVFYCKLGCNQALNLYVSKKKSELGIPSAPFIVANSVGNDSLAIEWKVNPVLNITFLVQWKYALLTNDWNYYRPEEKLTANRILIQNLHPHTEYQFRVAWILFPQFSPVFSEPSLPILTKAYGPPSTPPRFISVVAVSSNHISITWEPPMFPNGPILAYILYLQENSNKHAIIKEISLSNILVSNDSEHRDAPLHYMFSDLKGGLSYTISISSMNGAGEGPNATRVIETPRAIVEERDESEDAYLILASEKNVIKQSRDIMRPPEIVFRLNDYSALDNITSLAVHVSHKLIFVSDTGGNVRKISLSNSRNIQIQTIFKAKIRSSSKSYLLSTDWLNEKLYLFEGNAISSFDLNGNFKKDVVTGFSQNMAKFSDLHVDPYNGYLYWTYSDLIEGGIYRVDLSRFKDKVVHFQEAQCIYKDKSITVFTIDYSNFRLYFPTNSMKENTIISLTLGGEDSTDIRKDRVYSPQFNYVKNIVHYNETFFWTVGTEVYKEEYDEEANKFYHNAFSFDGDLFVSLQLFHRKSQPHPIPFNPVKNLEAIFSDTTGKVKWDKPSLLGGMSQGAWQEWLYEIRVEELNAQNITEIGNISETSCVLHELSPKTAYKINVRAYSEAGKGPWTQSFVGTTLKSIDMSTAFPSILWATKDGIIQSNIVGDGVTSVLNTIKIKRMPIKAITWYKDSVLFVANNSNIFVYNTTSYNHFQLPNTNPIKSIAIDWITPKLYWSNPMNHMISRSNLDGSHIETLPIMTLAKEIVIDAIHGKLFWATECSVECSQLNGFKHKAVFQLKHFSGKQVLSLTLDIDHKNIYWIVKSNNELILYKADLVFDDIFEKPVQFIQSIGHLKDSTFRSSLTYFDSRLFFVNHLNVLVTDLKGKNRAFLKPLGLQELEAITIMDPSLHQIPVIGKDTSVIVTPVSVNSSSVRVVGKWDNFTIVWDKIRNVNYGEVFYDISININGYFNAKLNLDRNLITKQSFFTYPTSHKLQPYSSLKVFIKSFTYWASSEPIIVDIFTPMSTPSKPANPRAFVYMRNEKIVVEFRWSPSLNPNGIISHYLINIWTYSKNIRIDHLYNKVIPGNVLFFVLSDVKKNMTFFFNVQAHTESGGGPFSDTIHVNTSDFRSIPKLLMSKNNSLTLFDVDFGKETVLTKKIINPIGITFIRKENTAFWIDEDRVLKSFDLQTNQLNALHTIDGKATSLTVDWISRQLLWSETDENKSVVWKMDLNSLQKPEILFDRSNVKINSLEIDPYSNLLFWTEFSSKEEGVIRKYDLKAKEMSSFFGKSNSHSDDCKCFATSPTVGKAISIERIGDSKSRILWTDERKGIIWSTDFDACDCQQVVNMGIKRSILAVASDEHNYYWITEPFRTLFRMPKQENNLPEISKSIEMSKNVALLKAFETQPYPERDCLSPLPYDSKVALISKGYSYLVFTIPRVRRPQHCENFSLPSIEYKLYYGKVFANNSFECDLSLKFCHILQTYNQTVALNNLEPYTNYSIRVGVSNYYTLTATLPGPMAIFDTKEWHPSPPTNVKVWQVSPFDIIISWFSPLHPNGDSLKYEIRWFSEKKMNSQFVQTTNITNPIKNKQFYFELRDKNLAPNTKYIFKVRAISNVGDLFSESESVDLITNESPNNLTIANRGKRFLLLSWLPPQKTWINRHSLEMLSEETHIWQQVSSQQTNNSTTYSFNVTQLKPNTLYYFRLVLTFKHKNLSLIWPPDGKFDFKTRGEIPSAPTNLLVINVKSGLYKITWNSVDAYGSKNLVYELFKKDEHSDRWMRVYRGMNNFWYPNRTETSDTLYIFKVRAVNEFGEGEFSEQSLPYQFVSLISTKTATRTIISYVVITLICIAIVLFVVYIFYKVKKQGTEKKAFHEMDIVPLPELPAHHHEDNAHYLAGDVSCDEELSSVPQITRGQIKLTKFLGSGAFAEVYEGVVHNLNNVASLKVAIKTLRNGATERQKAEFLKEAKLMGNFKHPHILQLLGICLDNNPFLIFELMGGGDLLSYLRLNRPEVGKPSLLTMDDLLKMCVDVAKGCEYLEGMHFVHRDLAARNCLVSSYARNERIVKIGDFGLARDIYKNDYYRKEGEGLLPVRWMAPESLVDGVFTTQSDIWSFGVLIWEVLTLGQHPYTARANIEVWNYVRSGGRLEVPKNCPNEL
ncbi:Proto-oncogene tyrosine-protein kinase ROS-like protein [Dinothrombium tinctorium]|uniref:Tyrosine-protein kinase receptor n=1 Tax=Dinothrombium tinctorium TaxID=1965070 RepID=A0A3S3NZ54_9ACAR|nr:Proto-oncogene tyrosine-protein kinase ROS-like protein [Dinothrombium tinctorium]